MRYGGDDDFDGFFEWRSDAEGGQIVIARLDSNGDGRPDAVTHVQHGVERSADIYYEVGQRMLRRRFSLAP